MVCLDRLCNSNAFARGFSASKTFGAVDQYQNAEIKYEIDNSTACLTFRKKTQRWAVSPKGCAGQLSKFGFASTVFVKADSNRISIKEDEIKAGKFIAADASLKAKMNELFETKKFSRLKRLKNTNSRGRTAKYFYVIEEGKEKYYSEKGFSTGELALLRLTEQLSQVKSNSLVLIDEAEMALHPRIQKRLLDYLKQAAAEKDLTIIVSTHSITLIKATEKNNILLLEDDGKNRYHITTPCYPAKAIGCVDFMDNIIYDAVFFVEDDMARLLLKKMIRICCEKDHRFTTITNCIVPVGGYEQTAHLAINTKSQLLGKSFVCAVWDEDVFDETIPNTPRIQQLYDNNKDMIFRLGCTPEVWMINSLEQKGSETGRVFRERFRCEIDSVIQSKEYTQCKAQQPRKLAKQKMDVVIDLLSASCGDSKEIVLDEFAQIIIDNCYTVNEIKKIVAPMLAKV